MAQLQQQGIAAGVVQDIEDLMERDNHLQQRGALVQLPHPHLGPFGHVRTPIAFSLDTPTPFRAPGIGEHNVDIASTIAGLSPGEIAALSDSGVFQ